jgi:hypothetical protein
LCSEREVIPTSLAAMSAKPSTIELWLPHCIAVTGQNLSLT